jgi:hypothetical protein
MPGEIVTPAEQGFDAGGHALKELLGFAWRRGFVFLLFVLALLVYQSRSVVAEPLQWRNIAEELRDGAQRLDRARKQATSDLAAARDRARNSTVQELQRQLDQSRRKLKQLEQQQDENNRGYIVKSDMNPSWIISSNEWKIKITEAQYEVDGLSAALAAANGRIASINDARQSLEEARRKCGDAVRRSLEFNRQPWIVRAWSDSTQGRIVQLNRKKRDECRAFEVKQSLPNLILRAKHTQVWAKKTIPDFTQRARQLAEQAEQKADASVGGHVAHFWKSRNMNSILIHAAGLLILSMATPYLIRVLFYYVFAPVAERRRRVRLNVPGSTGASIPSAAPSSTSVQVRLGADEQLLVRQGFLQTTSVGGAKRTVALLDWRHPVASWLTGLVALTSIRGENQYTTVSAIEDPFAEVTELTIPAGCAIVLHPRALVAVVQPVGRRMRITAHWRLLSLHAWLTLQLRYFVFHGPVRLVIRGGRGVRVERAERGRVFGSNQLVGFSADLAYSVTRTETFFPYFWGRESLLKDQVDEGAGVLIVEEAPLSLRGRGEVSHKLEGVFDAALKADGM